MFLKIIKHFAFFHTFWCVCLFSCTVFFLSWKKISASESQSSPPKYFPRGATCPRKAASNWKTSRLKVYFERHFFFHQRRRRRRLMERKWRGESNFCHFKFCSCDSSNSPHSEHNLWLSSELQSFFFSFLFSSTFFILFPKFRRFFFSHCTCPIF